MYEYTSLINRIPTHLAHHLFPPNPQAKSRQKQLDKMEEAGLIQPVVQERSVAITFPPCGKVLTESD